MCKIVWANHWFVRFEQLRTKKHTHIQYISLSFLYYIFFALKSIPLLSENLIKSTNSLRAMEKSTVVHTHDGNVNKNVGNVLSSIVDTKLCKQNPANKHMKDA